MPNESGRRSRYGIVEGERYLDPPESVTTSDYLAIVDLLTKESMEKSNRFRRLVPRMDELVNKLDNELSDRIGERQLRKCRELKNQLREKVSGGGRDKPLDQNALNTKAVSGREIREKMKSIMREASVDGKEINKIRQKYAKMIRNMENPEREGIELEVAEMVDESKVPKKILEATETNTPITKKPPYQYNYLTYYYSVYWSGYVIGPELINYLDPTSGMIGDRVEFHDVEAGDWDLLTVSFDTEVGFFKDIPKTGKWDVWLKLHCSDAWANQFYWDPMRFYDSSDVTTKMGCNIKFTANTFPPAENQPQSPNPGTRGLWWFTELSGDPEWGWHPTFPGWNGQDRFFHFTTANKIPAKDSTFIRVGFNDGILSIINDYTTKLIWKNKWILKQVSIDILT